MVADSCHREKNVQNREKTFGIEKKNLEYRKMFQGQKKIIKTCSKLIIKTAEWRQWHYYDIFIVNLNIFHTFL